MVNQYLERWLCGTCAARNLCLEEGAGKRCSEYELYGAPARDGTCIWRKVPESDSRSMSCMVCRTESDLEEGAGKRCWEYGLYGVPDGI